MLPRGTRDVMDKRVYEAGRVVFEEGGNGDAAYIVQSGSIGIFKDLDGERVSLATLGPGEIFGEMAVIDGSPRMAEAMALKQSVVVRISAEVFRNKLEHTDPFFRALLKILVSNLRSVHRSYVRRPRSFADFILHLGSISVNLRDYVAVAGMGVNSSDLAKKLIQLDSMVDDLRELAESHSDRRRNALSRDDLKFGG